MIDDATRAALKSSLIAMRGSLDSSVDALKDDPRMTHILDTHQAINTLEDVLELPITSLAKVFGLKQEKKKDD